MSYQLPELDYDALSPHFDKSILELHHGKHHQTYVNNSNTLLADLPEWQDKCPFEVIRNLDKLPDSKRTPVRNNVGGHANHAMFWKLLKKGTQPHGNLKAALERDFGSVDKFKEAFSQAATTLFGSGWVWLVLKGGKLEIVTTPNQDNPLMPDSLVPASGHPVVALDVWEHSYYPQFQNRRPDYVKEFWSVLNWDQAEQNFNEAK